jgi:ABC-2 type transport system permease protein
MSVQSEAVSAPTEPRKVRPFYWSVRRELWENRALYLAPLLVVAVVMAGFLFSLFRLPRAVLTAAAPGAKGGEALNMPYAAAAGALFVAAFVVAVFYCLSALQGERRDRSLLFWKSLPVSDLTTVLSKAAIPLVVQPLIVLIVAIAAQLVMLALSTLVLLANGISPALLWTHLHLPLIWAMLPYGLVVNVLWDVPLYGYLILVSAWARRMTFVWAVAPPLALSLFEYLAFRTKHVLGLLDDRVFGGYAEAFTIGGKGQAPIRGLSDVDPLRFLANPGLWTGLVFGAACLAICVWLRRRSEPI